MQGGKTRREDHFHRSLPRDDYLSMRLGDVEYELIRDDVRSLPALIHAINKHDLDTSSYGGTIGKRVADPMHTGYDLNVGGMLSW